MASLLGHPVYIFIHKARNSKRNNHRTKNDRKNNKSHRQKYSKTSAVESDATTYTAKKLGENFTQDPTEFIPRRRRVTAAIYI